MSKFNEAIKSSSTSLDVEFDGVRGENATGNEGKREEKTGLTFTGAEAADKKLTKSEDDKQGILKLTMLFNKYNSDLEVKRNSRSSNDEDEKPKYSMFFNKEVTIRSHADFPATLKSTDQKKPSDKVNGVYGQDSSSGSCQRTNRSKRHSRSPMAPEFGKPQVSEPEMMFSESLTSPCPERKIQSNTEKLKKFLIKKKSKAMPDSVVQLNVHPATRTHLRIHNSLTSLSKTSKPGLKSVLKSKIPSLTALDTFGNKNGCSRNGYWDHWEDLFLVQSYKDKKFDLQISHSSNDNNRRAAAKFKKEEAVSVSDSKLLAADSDFKKHIKKNDKKSRGDSSRKEKECGSRKQVQWKTEVDVIYFSTHLAANGDRSGEVIGRVMEPLREEWEQQRKGFYAKIAPSYTGTNVNEHFISLLKI